MNFCDVPDAWNIDIQTAAIVFAISNTEAALPIRQVVPVTGITAIGIEFRSAPFKLINYVRQLLRRYRLNSRFGTANTVTY